MLNPVSRYADLCRRLLWPKMSLVPCRHNKRFLLRYDKHYAVIFVRTSSRMVRPFPTYFSLTINDPLSWPANGPLNMICTCIDGDTVDMDRMPVPPESRASPVSSELNASVSSALNLH